MSTQAPSIARSRPKNNSMDQTITLTSLSGLSILEDTGIGAIRQTVFQFSGLVLAITDIGATGTFSQQIGTFPAGLISVMGAVQDIDIVLSAGTTAQVSTGSAALNADADLADAGEADICAASTASATVANAYRAAGNDTRLDGTTTAKGIYINGVTTGDPSSGATATLTGTLTITWRIDGDY